MLELWSFIFCLTVPTFKYSVLRIFTFKPNLCCIYVNIFVLYSDDVLFCSLLAVPHFCTSCSSYTVHFLRKFWTSLVINPHPRFIPLVILNHVDILFPVFTCVSFLVCIFWITTNISCGILISLIADHNSFLGTKLYASTKSTKLNGFFNLFLFVGLGCSLCCDERAYVLQMILRAVPGVA